MTTIIEGEQATRKAALLTQRMACKLEALGMQHSSGRSMLAHVKRTYGVKGKTKLDTYRAFYVYVEKEVFGVDMEPGDVPDPHKRRQR